MSNTKKKAELLIQSERERIRALETELLNRADALDRAIETGNSRAIKSAVNYLLDAEESLTGETHVFGELFEKHGVTERDFERHFERVQLEKSAH